MKKREVLANHSDKIPLLIRIFKKSSTWFGILLMGSLVIVIIEVRHYNHLRNRLLSAIPKYGDDRVISIQNGDREQVELPDGTKVWLNAASTLKYPSRMLAGDRVVELTGEAFFEVEHAASQPFRVKVRDMVVEVLGTKFDIRSYPEEPVYRTMVTEGSVKVVRGDNAVILTHGEQAEVDVDVSQQRSAPIKVTHGIDPDLTTGWTKGYLEFHNADLNTVLQDLSRAYDVDIQYEGPIPTNKFYGSFSMQESLEEVVGRLDFQGMKVKLLRKSAKKLTISAQP